MTVREILGVLRNARNAEGLHIGYGGGCTIVNPKDRIITEAFGDYCFINPGNRNSEQGQNVVKYHLGDDK